LDAETDARFMQDALALARMAWGLTNPNPMVGAILVRDGVVIGRGFHLRAGEPHAEVNAVQDARKRGFDCKGSTLYVTLEPCCSTGRTPPCTELILREGIARVVVGTLDPNPKHAGKGVEILREHGVEVSVGVEVSACSELNRNFFTWITTGKPRVMLKLATTLDGKIATASGDSKWVTGADARRRVQRLRRMADAILVGAETVRRDHPALTVREPDHWPVQPLRLVASSTMDGAELAEYFPDGNAEVVNLKEARDWEAFLLDLGRRNMVSLLIEGGGELAASALAADAVDDVEFHVAPKILGGRKSRPTVGGNDPEAMLSALEVHRLEVERCGNDVILSGTLRGEGI